MNVSESKGIGGYTFTPADPKKNESLPAVTTASETALNREDLNPEELIMQDPALKELFNKLTETFVETTKEEKFSIGRVISLLIELSQALQTAATAFAERLSKITEKLNAYTILQTQITVLGKEHAPGNDEKVQSEYISSINAKLSNMLEAIRNYRGMEEDKAKKVQTLLQGLKDGGSSASDFVTAFIDLLRGIGAKINQ